MSRYSLSTERLLSLIPTPLRSDSLIRLLMRLLVPVSYVHMLFTLYREKKEYRLSHTGQVFSLTQVICEFCGNDGCYITDGSYIDEVMVPYDGDGELANFQIWIPADASVTPAVTVPYTGMSQTEQSDFIVHLPAEQYGQTDDSSLRALINEYKLAGKMYGIVYDGVDVERYSFEWGGDVCVKAEEPAQDSYNFEWSGDVCVLDATFGFAWSDPLCVRREIPEPYTFTWSGGVCVKREIPEPYTFAWSGGVCVKREITEPYTFTWNKGICVLTEIKAT